MREYRQVIETLLFELVKGDVYERSAITADTEKAIELVFETVGKEPCYLCDRELFASSQIVVIDDKVYHWLKYNNKWEVNIDAVYTIINMEDNK